MSYRRGMPHRASTFPSDVTSLGPPAMQCHIAWLGNALDGAEADAPGVRLGDLDVGELVRRNDHSPALLVDQRQRRGAIFDGLLDRRLDLVGALGPLDRQLPRGAFDANPDLHVGQA